ncbi:MAG: archaetidylserine decarboxylase [Myxococcales bacterium]|nr:archaetidylserine decarboxylase [Polyangiaceae bacterium]MDW8248296.1 archaetidylserine decarboxylase [Myxococcales bacterium]
MLPFRRSPAPAPIQYIDRRTGELRTEVVLGEALVRFVYERIFGRLLRRAVLTRPGFSKLYGRYQSSPLSRRALADTIRKLAINMNEYEVPPGGFRHFNDFFTRRLRPGARPIDPDPRRIVSPADGRTFVYTKVQGDTLLPAKGRSLSLRALLGGDEVARPFRDGVVFIVRLCPSDYHRFHFPCAGQASAPRTLAGPLESVNPWALARGRPILDTNQRDLTLLDSPTFGRIACLEIGAMCVGSIVQTFRAGPVSAGEEKGYFQFGGSTVVLVFEPARIVVDEDLVANTRKGLETFLRMGEGVASATS